MKIKTIVAIAALLAVPQSSAFAQQLPPRTASGASSASASSWLAGAEMGYNWQNGAVVYGLATDLSAMALKSSMTSFLSGTIVPPPMANTDAHIDWYGTVRGRLGWSSGPVLFYGTAGLAYGNVDVNSTISVPSLGLQITEPKIGWVAGGGIEYMWRPNVILSLAYQYVDLGTVGFATAMPGFGGPTSINGTAHAQFQVATIGLTWLFTPTDKAPHGAWEGAYLGGHVGGAWGDRTNVNYAATQVFLSDVRLKHDIALVGRRDDGLGLYSYRYLWSDTVYVGVMAQEVALMHPDAVVRSGLDSYLRVDYSRLGLKLMTLPEWDARGTGERL
jgi:outer membrane immunogenic protein